MITITKSADRHCADHGWLKTHWHFSFSDYYDPKNMHWSVLRVFNDDIVAPASGFPMHPHADMEIVTYVISGRLEHQDDKGNRGIVHPGEVQVMSAGSGIVHSEFNPSSDTPVHLIQLWILPAHKHNPPRWEQKRFSPAEQDGKLLPVVSSGNIPGTLAIDQDVTIFVSRLAAGKQVTHQSANGRSGYLFVIAGDLAVNEKKSLTGGDQARVRDENNLVLTAETAAEFIFLDLP